MESLWSGLVSGLVTVAGFVIAIWVAFLQINRSDQGALVDACLEQLGDLHTASCVYWANQWSPRVVSSISGGQTEEEEKLKFRLAFIVVCIETIAEADGSADVKRRSEEVVAALLEGITGGQFEVDGRLRDLARLTLISSSCRDVVVFLARVRKRRIFTFW